MPRKNIKTRNTRKLVKSGGKSFSLTLPIDIIRELGWRFRQKVSVKKYRRGILLKDWKAKKNEKGVAKLTVIFSLLVLFMATAVVIYYLYNKQQRYDLALQPESYIGETQLIGTWEMYDENDNPRATLSIDSKLVSIATVCSTVTGRYKVSSSSEPTIDFGLDRTTFKECDDYKMDDYFESFTSGNKWKLKFDKDTFSVSNSKKTYKFIRSVEQEQMPVSTDNSIDTPTQIDTSTSSKPFRSKLGFSINVPKDYTAIEANGILKINSPIHNCKTFNSMTGEEKYEDVSEGSIDFKIHEGTYETGWREAFDVEFAPNVTDGANTIDGKKNYFFYQGAEMQWSRNGNLIALSPIKNLEMNVWELITRLQCKDGELELSDKVKNELKQMVSSIKFD